MTSVVDRFKEHFSRQPVREIEVPEMLDEEGKPLVIYASPMTLSEKQRAHTVGEQEGYIARLAHILVMKAKDAQGKPIFTIADKRALLHNSDSDVIARIVTEIMRASSTEEAEKK